jgi:hypothetical protein
MQPASDEHPDQLELVRMGLPAARFGPRAMTRATSTTANTATHVAARRTPALPPHAVHAPPRRRQVFIQGFRNPADAGDVRIGRLEVLRRLQADEGLSHDIGVAVAVAVVPSGDERPVDEILK